MLAKGVAAPTGLSRKKSYDWLVVCAMATGEGSSKWYALFASPD